MSDKITIDEIIKLSTEQSDYKPLTGDDMRAVEDQLINNCEGYILPELIIAAPAIAAKCIKLDAINKMLVQTLKFYARNCPKNSLEGQEGTPTAFMALKAIKEAGAV